MQYSKISYLVNYVLCLLYYLSKTKRMGNPGIYGNHSVPRYIYDIIHAMVCTSSILIRSIGEFEEKCISYFFNADFVCHRKSDHFEISSEILEETPDIPGVFSQGETSEMLEISRPEVSICCPVNLIAF